MDNITHTLTGLALAKSGLNRTTRLATATLVIAANLPDLDGFSYLLGSATDALAFRRGWTHGVLAMVLLPPLLAGVMLGWARLRRREGMPVHGDRLLLVAAIGVLSHPLMDLLNTYGVRLLMPFSGRWYYGDALFIVDPWVWLVLAAGLVLGSRSGAGPLAPRAALALFGVYAVVMAAASRAGVALVERKAEQGPAQRTLASPVFGNPFERRVIRELGDHYELGRLALRWPLRYSAEALQSSGRDEPAALLAARRREGEQFLRWARFPSFRVERVGGQTAVTIRDLRYGGNVNRTWASVTIVIGESGIRNQGSGIRGGRNDGEGDQPPGGAGGAGGEPAHREVRGGMAGAAH